MELYNAILNAFWETGYIIPGQDSNIFRVSRSGRLIKKAEFMNRESRFGWYIIY